MSEAEIPSDNVMADSLTRNFRHLGLIDNAGSLYERQARDICDDSFIHQTSTLVGLEITLNEFRAIAIDKL